MNKLKLYNQALKKWGTEAQVMMLFEEIAELSVKICHAGRKDKIVFTCDLIDELADVEIMLEQIAVVFNIPKENIRSKKNEKLKRLQKRLEE